MSLVGFAIRVVQFDKNKWSRESMKYVGVAKKKGSSLEMPGGFEGAERYEVLDFDGKVVLVPIPFEVVSTEEVGRLAREAIEEHRKILEALAR